MTEGDWLASEDPGAMLHHLRYAPVGVGGRLRGTEEGGRSLVSDRKLRLFACACLRLCWGRLDERSREAVGCAEAWADGATSDDRERAGLAALTHTGCLADDPADAARQALVLSAARGATPAAQVALLRDVCGNPFRPVFVMQTRAEDFARRHGHIAFEHVTPTVLDLARAAYEEGRVVRCGHCGGRGSLPRDLLNGDFMTDPCPDCRGTGRTSDGLLDPDRFAVLADALEEAGCDSAEVLGHLRSPGPHCRGCHALDLILGRA